MAVFVEAFARFSPYLPLNQGGVSLRDGDFFLPKIIVSTLPFLNAHGTPHTRVFIEVYAAGQVLCSY